MQIKFAGPDLVVFDDLENEHRWFIGAHTKGEQENIERAMRRMYALGRNSKARDIAIVMEPESIDLRGR